MQRLEVSGAVRPIYGSLGVKRIRWSRKATAHLHELSQSRVVEPMVVALRSMG